VNIGRFFTTIQFFTEAGLNMPHLYLKLAYKEKIPEIKKKYNPVPDDMFWLRSIDSDPKLLSKQDFLKLCKNKVDISKLDKPDSSVWYNV
jgi:carbamoyl-phosphate synthase large subunit